MGRFQVAVFFIWFSLVAVGQPAPHDIFVPGGDVGQYWGLDLASIGDGPFRLVSGPSWAGVSGDLLSGVPGAEHAGDNQWVIEAGGGAETWNIIAFISGRETYGFEF